MMAVEYDYPATVIEFTRPAAAYLTPITRRGKPAAMPCVGKYPFFCSSQHFYLDHPSVFVHNS
jgi:hypothetical protein